MKIGIAQINTTVGDLAGNQQRILDAYRRLVADGAELILYPELTLCGYPPRDLLFKSRFVSDVNTTLKTLAKEIDDVPAIIGFVESRNHCCPIPMSLTKSATSSPPTHRPFTNGTEKKSASLFAKTSGSASLL